MNTVENDLDSTTRPELKAGRPRRKTSKKVESVKKTVKRARGNTTDRTNKKVEIIAMMKRPKGATLAEIIETTGWQPHTVRGFVSLLGSKGGEKIESNKSAAGERTYRIAK